MQIRRFVFGILLTTFLLPLAGEAQCSVCTRNTEQLGETPAQKINMGIFYLAAAPLAICGIIGYRWWKKNG